MVSPFYLLPAWARRQASLVLQASLSCGAVAGGVALRPPLGSGPELAATLGRWISRDDLEALPDPLNYLQINGRAPGQLAHIEASADSMVGLEIPEGANAVNEPDSSGASDHE